MDIELNDQQKNITQHGWTNRELNGCTSKITLNRYMDGELNYQHKNTKPYGWMDRELHGQS